MAVKFAIGVYRLLWDALRRQQFELERELAAADDEDCQLILDNKMQRLDGMFCGIAISANADWDLNLGNSFLSS